MLTPFIFIFTFHTLISFIIQGLMSTISTSDHQIKFFKTMINVEREFDAGFAMLRNEADQAREKNAGHVFSTHKNTIQKPRSDMTSFDLMVLETQRHAAKWSRFCERMTRIMKDSGVEIFSTASGTKLMEVREKIFCCLVF